MRLKVILRIIAVLLLSLPLAAQSKRKVIIDQDARGPATTDQQSMIVLLQSPIVETLGITIVSGDQWRDEEVAHTLRMLEIIGTNRRAGVSRRRLSPDQSPGND